MNNFSKDTFLIVYAGGAYGTFLDWCINWFSGQIEENILPFTDNGSAHRWLGNPAGDLMNRPEFTIDRMLELSYDQVPLTIRSHVLSTDYTNGIHENLIRSYQSKFKKVILINNNTDCQLLLLHNRLTKCKGSSYENTINEIVSNYKNVFGATEPIPPWQLREMISYWYDSWHCEVRDTWQPIFDENIVNVDIKNLVYNFEECLCNLFDTLDLPMPRRDRLLEIKNTWLSLQKFKNLDHDLDEIVSAAAQNQTPVAINCENLFDEAFIQWKLRVVHNLDLMCDGLDEFPKNTKDLRALLIPYKNEG